MGNLDPEMTMRPPGLRNRAAKSHENGRGNARPDGITSLEATLAELSYLPAPEQRVRIALFRLLTADNPAYPPRRGETVRTLTDLRGKS